MITYNNITLRNLQEQVLHNKERIEEHWEIDRVLADYGIHILGQLDTVEELPAEAASIGDAYLVGEESPYDTYIWTRANIDAGHPLPYWLNAGALNIIGPQGDKGDKGDKGDTGEAAQWYGGATFPTNPTPTAMYLDNKGNVYRYSENNKWELQTNITGPTGPQGAKGEKGEKGEKGDKGDTGPQGPVSAAFNIKGILTNANLLPSAVTEGTGYLIGESTPYNLYLALNGLWTNIGLFNTGSIIYKDGYFLSVFDITDYLESAETASIIYGTNAAGEQTHITYAETPIAASLCLRNSNGEIYVPITPTNAASALSKQYVEDNYIAIPTAAAAIPATNENKVQIELQYSTSPTAASIPLRDNYGNIQVAETPIAAADAASKAYVDNKPLALFHHHIEVYVYSSSAKYSRTYIDYYSTDNTKINSTAALLEKLPSSICAQGIYYYSSSTYPIEILAKQDSSLYIHYYSQDSTSLKIVALTGTFTISDKVTQIS